LGLGSSFGIKKLEVGLIELPETTVDGTLLLSLDNMEPRAMVKAMVEFSSKALILSHRVGSLL